MLEQYIYDKITNDETLQELLAAGSDSFHVYPNVIPRSVNFEQALTFTLIITRDVYPGYVSRDVQFNIFAKTHAKTVQIANALANLFNEDNNQNEDGVKVVYSQRHSESDLGFDFDEGENYYQREATYYFKMR